MGTGNTPEDAPRIVGPDVFACNGVIHVVDNVILPIEVLPAPTSTPTSPPILVPPPEPTDAPILVPPPEPTGAPILVPPPEPTDAPILVPPPEPTDSPSSAPSECVTSGKIQSSQCVSWNEG